MISPLQKALVISPHPDDEVLGCGGTIAGLAAAGVEVRVLSVAADVPPLYAADVAETVRREALQAHALLGVSESRFLDHPSVELARMPVAELNHGIQQVVDDFQPHLVFLPFPDRHLDHKAVFEAAMVATRPVAAGWHIRTLAMYETISETHWNAPLAEPAFTPDWFVDISGTLETKLAAFQHYASQVQADPGPRSVRALNALAKFRGSQIGRREAEAFQTVRRVTELCEEDVQLL